jgi:hypothetical protein
MALGENEGMSTTMLVSPTGGNINTGYAYPAPVYALGNQNGGGMGFGGDWGSLITLFLLFGMFGGGFGGFGGGYGGFGGYDFPWLLTGQQGINNNTNAGFRDAQISDSITSVRDGISGLSTQLCGCCGDMQMSLANGFSGVNASINGAQNALAQQLYTNQLADLERSFAAQTANTAGLTNLSTQLAQCCCDNRAATQDVKFTIAQEECATRANSTANTQAILDKLCQLELDGYKRENDNLRSQLQFANMQASQVAQTSELRTSQATVANQLVQELRSCPIPAQPVYGNSPIFTCAQNVAGGCGCGFNG